MILPDMARALPATASDSAPDWRMKRQPGSLELFCFLPSCIKIHATIAWAPGLSKNASEHALYPHPCRRTKYSGGRASPIGLGCLGSIADQQPFECRIILKEDRGVGCHILSGRDVHSVRHDLTELVNEFGPGSAEEDRWEEMKIPKLTV